MTFPLTMIFFSIKPQPVNKSAKNFSHPLRQTSPPGPEKIRARFICSVTISHTLSCLLLVLTSNGTTLDLSSHVGASTHTMQFYPSTPQVSSTLKQHDEMQLEAFSFFLLSQGLRPAGLGARPADELAEEPWAGVLGSC